MSDYKCANCRGPHDGMKHMRDPFGMYCGLCSPRPPYDVLGTSTAKTLARTICICGDRVHNPDPVTDPKGEWCPRCTAARSALWNSLATQYGMRETLERAQEKNTPRGLRRALYGEYCTVAELEILMYRLHAESRGHDVDWIHLPHGEKSSSDPFGLPGLFGFSKRNPDK